MYSKSILSIHPLKSTRVTQVLDKYDCDKSVVIRIDFLLGEKKSSQIVNYKDAFNISKTPNVPLENSAFSVPILQASNCGVVNNLIELMPVDIVPWRKLMLNSETAI